MTLDKIELAIQFAELGGVNVVLTPSEARTLLEHATRTEKAEDKLQRILTWCNAYPLDVFPEPDFKRAHELLTAGGMTLDAISASNMRHVLDGIKEIISGDYGDAGIRAPADGKVRG